MGSTEARFRRPEIEGTRWRYGRLVNDYPAEPLAAAQIVVDDTGGTYVVRPEFVQVRVTGPRGGKKWLPL